MLDIQSRWGNDSLPEAGEREASIKDDKGKVLFSQKVVAPKSWSDTAVNIVASKYFHGENGTPERENSAYDLVKRVATWITNKGVEGNYFDKGNAARFFQELVSILINQRASFNSPVWFNVGVKNGKGYGYTPQCDSIDKHWFARKVQPNHGDIPQCSACFIQSVSDTMEGIMELAKSEAMLFRLGSGTGTNFSPLREEGALLSNGGRASGPLSFCKGFDSFAGVIKSGGKTRRAAKMVILDSDHPDIEKFVEAKAIEEKKAQALIQAGFTPGMEGEAYQSVNWQNSNNSVRVDDTFMNAVESNHEYPLIGRKRGQRTGEVKQTVYATELFRSMAQAAWASGDPGIQFDTVINQWHTCPNSGRINASNPCSEYMFLDDSACNLASINLLRFWNGTSKGFDLDGYLHTVRIILLAQEIMVDYATYPTATIAENSHRFRPLGLGYANLGALLMVMGIPYDSDLGRQWCGVLTALMGGEAYRWSSVIAAHLGPFEGFSSNREPMLQVINNHAYEAEKLWGRVISDNIDHDLSILARKAWDIWNRAVDNGSLYGYRNSQVTVLAPTGTIGFMMDCDTTGIEPELGLVKYKKLSGGGQMMVPNRLVGHALATLDYDTVQISETLDRIQSFGTIEGSGIVSPAHLPVFDTSFKPVNGTRFIRPLAHLLMMSAAQPFLSGAISKTVNLPESSTVEEIESLYLEAWKLGLKSVAVYRDNCKSAQPLNSGTTKETSNTLLNNEIKKSPYYPDLPNVTVTDETQLNSLRMAKAADNELKLKAKSYLTQASQREWVKNLVDKFPQGVPGELFIQETPAPTPYRRKMPNERQSITKKFNIAGHEGYVTVGLYPDGTPGELFIAMSKEGSTLSGVVDGFGIAISHALQYGVPLQFLCDKYIGMSFEPCGYTGDPQIPYAKSIYDFVFQWLKAKFVLPGEQGFTLGGIKVQVDPNLKANAGLDAMTLNNEAFNHAFGLGKANDIRSRSSFSGDGPPCSKCGSIMSRNGTCWKCENCGETTGC